MSQQVSRKLQIQLSNTVFLNIRVVILECTTALVYLVYHTILKKGRRNPSPMKRRDVTIQDSCHNKTVLNIIRLSLLLHTKMNANFVRLSCNASLCILSVNFHDKRYRMQHTLVSVHSIRDNWTIQCIKINKIRESKDTKLTTYNVSQFSQLMWDCSWSYLFAVST